MPKASKPDPALVAVLINREHSRLSSQVKTLEKALYAPFSGLHGTPTFKKRKRAERCAQVSRERLREVVEVG